MFKKRVYQNDPRYNEISEEPIIEGGTGKLYKPVELEKGLQEDPIISRGINLMRNVRVNIPGCIAGEVRGFDRDAGTVMVTIVVPAEWVSALDGEQPCQQVDDSGEGVKNDQC